jgi:formylglycine-generating enzyme required for sulfatase activity
MKHELTPSVTRAPESGRLVGLSILGVIVVVVAAWLTLQGKQLHSAASATQKHLAIDFPDNGTANFARFRADSWYLPSEALLGFVEIPAGSFVMGSDPAIDTMAFENERWSLDSNQGTVSVPTFYIGRYEVTVAQFAAFSQATGFGADQAWRGAPDHPVANVSWTDALAYSRWLTEQLKHSSQTPAPLAQLLLDGWQITLPTEAQWEKAARGTDGRIYPWGNTATQEQANFAGMSTTRVGNVTCTKCAFNLADMSGNVWELTRSAYRPYPFNPASSLDLSTDALFVMRGGSYNDTDGMIRTATRGGIDPGARRAFIGFRLVISPP